MVLAIRGIRPSPPVLALLLGALAGGLTPWLTWYLQTDGLMLALGLLALWLAALAATVRFDLVVFLTFCLFGIVRIEPAPSDVLSMLLLAVGLATGRLSPKSLNGLPLIHVFAWILLLVNVASLLSAPQLLQSLRFMMITVYLLAFTYFVKMYVTSPQALGRIAVAYLVTVLVNMLLVLLGYLGFSPFAEMFLQDGVRAVGAFKDPNVFGPFAIPIVVFLVDEILYPSVLPRFRAAKVLGVVVATSAVLLSLSRAAWGNLLIAVLTYAVLNARRLSRAVTSPLVWGLASALLIVLASGLYWSVIVQLRLDEQLGWRLELQDYDTYRFARQATGVDAGLTHLFGVGPGVWDNAHSLYARVLAEHGVFGFASLSLLIFVLLVGTLRRALLETGKPYGLSAKVVLACFLGLLFNSAVIDTIHWRHFWLVLALAWVVSTPEGPVPGRGLWTPARPDSSGSPGGRSRREACSSRQPMETPERMLGSR